MAASSENQIQTSSIEFDPFDANIVLCIVDGVPYAVDPSTIRLELQHGTSLKLIEQLHQAKVSIEFRVPDSVEKPAQMLNTNVVLVNESLVVKFLNPHLNFTKTQDSSTTFGIIATNYVVEKR